MFLIVWTGANVALTILLILAVRRARKMAEILERAGNLQMDFLRETRVIMRKEAEAWTGKEELQQESQPV
ncbi:hypothetical protein SAMN05216583_12115 [Selenomonas sp. KH1T6]|nr:hypothetical protein SAMN05216583_12115 [Selenomonas ruminantium]